MIKIDISNTKDISGGNPVVLFPIVGCAVVTGMDYAASDGMSYGEMGCSCAKGAIHGANLGMGITAPIGNQYVRYGAGLVYARYAPGMVDSFVSNNRSVLNGRNYGSTFLGGSGD